MPVQTSSARLSARVIITPEEVLGSNGKVFNDKAFDLYQQVESEIGERNILLRVFYVTYEAVAELPAEESAPDPDDGPRTAQG